MLAPRSFSSDLAASDQWERVTAPLLAVAVGQQTSSVVYAVDASDLAGVDIMIGNVAYDLKHNFQRFGPPENPEVRIEHNIGRQWRLGCDYFVHVWTEDPSTFFLISAPFLLDWVRADGLEGYPTLYSHSSHTAFSPVPWADLVKDLPQGAARRLTGKRSVAE